MPNPTAFLTIVSTLTVAGLTWSASHGSAYAVNAVALAFALAAIWTAWRLNASSLRRGPEKAADRTAAVAQLQATSVVTAMIYAWGGAAMFMVYELTGLHWRHGWQYGSIMLLIAAGLFAYVRVLDDRQSRLTAPAAVDRVVQLAALHGLATAVALGWLVLSGKLDTVKGDWAANAIFLAGGVSIIAISAMAVRAHRALTRAQASPAH